MNKIVILVFIIISVLTAQAYSAILFRSGKTIECTVVDDSTGEPVEGVYVVIRWNKIGISLGGDVPQGVIKIREAITDKNGFCKFDGWVKLAPLSILSKMQIAVTVFKPGYNTIWKRNYFPEKGENIFRLQKHQGTFEERKEAFFYMKETIFIDLDKSKYIGIPQVVRFVKENKKNFYKKEETINLNRKKVY